MRRIILVFNIALILISFSIKMDEKLPEGFVVISDVVPTIKIDLRYASNNNFIGKPIDGYLSKRCIVTKETALALQKVQNELNEQGLCLQIYDGYRPQKAVNHFVRWARNYNDTLMKSKYYPNIKKQLLFKKGYISSKSRHSSGSTVDVTIFSDAINDVIDMGSNYDYFGEISAITYGRITKKQKRNRILLLRIMQKYGFRSYAKEWWHFTLKKEPFKNKYFDFDIE